MGRKHVIKLDMLDNSGTPISGDMSAPITSRLVHVNELDKASIHCKWVAGPAGTFTVEVQNTEADQWYALDTGQPWAVTSSDSEVQIVLTELPFINLRLVWTPTSGSGTMTSYLTSKTVAA